MQEHFPTFKAVYAGRYQERYGYWRPIVNQVVEAFLRCGDLQQGFARVRCPDCGHELFVAFSCKQRSLCPSCHEKRALGTALHVSETVCADVPHRQFVFTLPKRFRLYFRYERSLLGELVHCAWETVLEVYQAAAGAGQGGGKQANDRSADSLSARSSALPRDPPADEPSALLHDSALDLAGVPGMMAGLQTFGDLIHWHPHVHALATEGVFDAKGQFIPLPKLANEPFLKLWAQKVFHLLVSQGKITPEVVAEMKTWQHSGFSVDQSVRLEAGDRAGISRLVQYILRCPFSQARLLRVTPEGQVLYKASRTDCHRFPAPGSDDLSAGVKRNFQVFEPLDFLAEVTQHRSSAKCEVRVSKQDRQIGSAKASGSFRIRHSSFVIHHSVVDPLLCPQCGGTMKIISFIEAHQKDVIEKILRHCGLWTERRGRDPPAASGAEPPGEGQGSVTSTLELRTSTFGWPAEEVQDFPPDEQNPGWDVSWAEYGE
jgi:hypothetical protein